jgi:hypothetical protein
MDPNIKSFTVTPSSMTGGKPKKPRGTRKNAQDGVIESNGGGTVITKIGGAVNSIMQSSPAPVNYVQPTIIAHTPRIVPAPSVSIYAPPAASQQQQQTQQQQTGGNASDKHIKVELRKHTTHKKIHLNPKNNDAPKQIHKKEKTKKARKVTVGVTTLHKRMTRAKKLRDKVKDMPIDKLKEELIKKKLIKPTSKAPESVLRQIATDAHIVAGKAL